MQLTIAPTQLQRFVESRDAFWLVAVENPSVNKSLRTPADLPSQGSEKRGNTL